MRAFMFIAVFLLLDACAVGPRYAGPPAVAAQPGWVEGAATTAVVGDPAWWRSLDDPVLS